MNYHQPPTAGAERVFNNYAEYMEFVNEQRLINQISAGKSECFKLGVEIASTACRQAIAKLNALPSY